MSATESHPYMTVRQARAGMHLNMNIDKRPEFMEPFERVTTLVCGRWAPLPQFIAAAVLNQEELNDEEMAQRAFRLSAADRYLQANPETVVLGISRNKFVAGRTAKESILLVHPQPQFDAERATLGVPTMTSLDITRPPGYIFHAEVRAHTRGGVRMPLPSTIIMPHNLDSARQIGSQTEGLGIMAIGTSAVEAVLESITNQDPAFANPDLTLAVQLARPLLSI